MLVKSRQVEIPHSRISTGEIFKKCPAGGDWAGVPTQASPRRHQCSVILDIKIKLITVNTISKDPQVKSHPCIISINGEHNHNRSASALRELRVLPETKEEFFKYLDAAGHTHTGVAYLADEKGRG
ncbi:hypothetical protein GWK47_017224 [Chionoecetes opilio]|uniref:Uncharacterized protein n=1 Tax=Chionoecetes opilio TaxID=41210 RepID=A0A8J4XTY4_CHIOP|nr:hypothetical protein GWK47_017224 [Chionoecetes opilio]